jgi:hypothetical protein
MSRNLAGRSGVQQAMRRWLAIALLSLIGVTSAGGQEPVDVSRVGPQAGDAVPDFALPDHGGTVRTLTALAGSRGTMLVFSRSADW